MSVHLYTVQCTNVHSCTILTLVESQTFDEGPFTKEVASPLLLKSNLSPCFQSKYNCLTPKKSLTSKICVDVCMYCTNTFLQMLNFLF